jgi:hypothetical protein
MDGMDNIVRFMSERAVAADDRQDERTSRPNGHDSNEGDSAEAPTDSQETAQKTEADKEGKAKEKDSKAKEKRQRSQQEWIEKAEAENKAVVFYSPGHVIPLLPDLNAALGECDDPGLTMFERGAGLVTIERQAKTTQKEDGLRRAEGAYYIASVSPRRMQQFAEKAALFLRLDKRSNEYFVSDCPVELAHHYLESASNRTLPTLHAIAEAPTLRGDGSVVQEPGYDPDSKLFLVFKPKIFPRVEDHPSRSEADNALMQLRHVVRGIAFKGAAKDLREQADENGDVYIKPTRDVGDPETCTVAESVWLAALMTSVIRAALPTAPFFVFSSPTKGSAKTLAADLCGIAATGHRQACAPWAKSEEERRKALFAHPRYGDPVMLIDNLDNGEEINCPRFAAILTQPSYKDRILGHSEEETVPTTTTFLMTGNNVTVCSDLTRRALRCYIDPETEQPERRKYDWDARTEVAEKRPNLVKSVLPIIRAYLSATEEDGLEAPTTSAVGSFELWDRYVRQPLVWLGCKDPMISQTEIRDEDPAGSDIAEVFEAWFETYGDQPVTTADVLGHVDGLRQARAFSAVQNGIKERTARLEASLDHLEDTGGLSSKSFGKWLGQQQHKIVDGLRLDCKGRGKHARQWFLTDTCEDNRPVQPWTPDRFEEAAQVTEEDPVLF